MPASYSVLDIEELASPKVFERGKRYYEDRSIVTTVIRGNRLEAFCYGSQVYRVTAIVSDSGIGMTTCSCPYDWGGICKHRVALLLTYLHEPTLFVERSTIADLLADKDKDALISMIETILNRYPTLLSDIDPDLALPDELFWDDETY